MGIKKQERDLLASGKRSFKIEVPYQLIENGKKGNEKPLIVYLHGYGENIKSFQKKCNRFLDINAYHLFIQGPYPIYDKSQNKTVSNWGSSWYLYDGKRKQFIKSLEITSEFIQEVIDNLIKFINVSKICIIGYSMGGYQAGFFALTRWKHIHDVVVVGARIKAEVLNENNFEHLRHMNILAVHGQNDDKVSYEPQKEVIDLLRNRGVNSELKLLDENHDFSPKVIDEILNWLQSKDYVIM